MNDLLIGIGGGGQRATGIYRLVISILVAALLGSVTVLGWFARDELTTWRAAITSVQDSISTISNALKSHVDADVQVRGATGQTESGIDVRVSRLEQHQDDVGKQLGVNQQDRVLELQALQQALQQQSASLIGVERELSVIEGRLDIVKILPK